MKKILCFGNPYLEDDNLALRIADEIVIPGVKFVKLENPSDVMQHLTADGILDVAPGIEQVRVLSDLSKLKPHLAASLHDFDLSFFLKLMEASGRVNQMRLIVIPQNWTPERCEAPLKALL